MKKRKAKEGNIRKQEFLDHALQLFSEKGYEAATVNDIINSVGVSKGAFYHYFNSKEEVLNNIVEEYIQEIADLSKKIADEPGKTAFEKYRSLFQEVQKRRIQNRKKFYFLSVMMVSDKNILFSHRFSQQVLALTKQPYGQILKQGKESGEFNIDDPFETAEWIIHFGTIYRTRLWKLFLSLKDHPENMEKIHKLIHFMQHTMERILGLPQGKLSFISESFENFLNNYQHENSD